MVKRPMDIDSPDNWNEDDLNWNSEFINRSQMRTANRHPRLSLKKLVLNYMINCQSYFLQILEVVKQQFYSI